MEEKEGRREDIRTDADGEGKEEKNFVGGARRGNPYMEGQARKSPLGKRAQTLGNQPLSLEGLKIFFQSLRLSPTSTAGPTQNLFFFFFPSLSGKSSFGQRLAAGIWIAPPIPWLPSPLR